MEAWTDAETKKGKEMRPFGIPEDFPTIVCLCGSGRFQDAFDKAAFNATLSGKVVLTIGCNTKVSERSQELSGFKTLLDDLHLRKIDLADEVLILNVGGYIGESTRRELNYALEHGKTVRYLESYDHPTTT